MTGPDGGEIDMFNKMRKVRFNSKAISPVVATLLLIAIAVAAAIVSYSWIMSMIKTQDQPLRQESGLKLWNFPVQAMNGLT